MFIHTNARSNGYTFSFFPRATTADWNELDMEIKASTIVSQLIILQIQSISWYLWPLVRSKGILTSNAISTQ